MSDIARGILLIPLAVVFYGSGLLLWPIRRWLCRKRAVRGKSLGFVFLGQLISFVATIIVAVVRPRMLEHGYYWFIVLIELLAIPMVDANSSHGGRSWGAGHTNFSSALSIW